MGVGVLTESSGLRWLRWKSFRLFSCWSGVALCLICCRGGGSVRSLAWGGGGGSASTLCCEKFIRTLLSTETMFNSVHLSTPISFLSCRSALCHADRHEAGQQNTRVPKVPGQTHGPAGDGKFDLPLCCLLLGGVPR